LAWSFAAPLSLVGSQVAHWFAYWLVAPGRAERSHLLASSGHGYLAYAPFGLAVCTAAGALAFAAQVRGLIRGNGAAARPALWMFALLGPAIFCFQEHLERLIHDGGFPWSASSDPAFLVGLALRVPVAVLAYVVARAVLRVAERIALRVLKHRRRPVRTVVVAACAAAPPLRTGLLALGYPTRGPPSSLG
jgi:hypothetical protein